MKVFVATLVLAAARRPSSNDDGPHRLWEWIEAHANVVYPLIAIAIIGLIAGAAMAAMKGSDINAERAGHLKREIMLLIRRRISGVSAEQVAAEIQIDLMLAARLLQELEQEGMVSSSGRAPVQYRIRGMN